jgi:predicted ATPase
VSTWLKAVLVDGVQRLVLNSLLMRRASPPGQPRGFRPDGSNLPWVIEHLRKSACERHQDWVAHIRTALPDVQDITTIERPEDRHRYLVVCYRDGLQVPSWMVSDGTLRLLALTLPAYLPDLEGIYLIEEPENGIHPRAVETAFQSLSSVYGAQILLATHSPVILSIAEANQVLCFSKTESGATDIVRGSEHPRLRDWKGETNLGVLFAGGVLG